MIDFQSFASTDTMLEEQQETVPQIAVVDEDDRYGKFVAEPLPQGYGMTLGNPLRRVLYNSLVGAAVTSVKIDGVLHEYATIDHVKEQVSDILLNIKGIRLRSQVDRQGKLRLEVAGQGEVCAGDIMASSDFEVVNPEWHLATLDSDEARLSIELNVERGIGYAEASEGDGVPIGTLPVDAIFTPVRKVSYRVEDTRVGQRTDLERLIIEIWTDGSISPLDALRDAGKILVDKFFLFSNTQRDSEEGERTPSIALTLTPEQYNMTVEQLQLSSRTLNCLKRAGIDNAGQALEMSKADLLDIRNFGEKSLRELYEQFRAFNLIPSDVDPDQWEQTDASEWEVGARDDEGTEI